MRTSAQVAAALLCTICLAGAALATVEPGLASNPDDQAEKLTSLVVKAFPIGSMFQDFIDRDPTWPLLAKVAKAEPGQLECLRERLSNEGFRAVKLAEARAFVAANSQVVSESIQVLEQGGAELMASAFRAGVDAKATGRAPNYADIATKLTPLQLIAVVELMGEEKFRPLRNLIGIADSVKLGAPGAENESRGKDRGAMMAMKLMLGAMHHCKVPLSITQ
jgi:hypothetical protein